MKPETVEIALRAYMVHKNQQKKNFNQNEDRNYPNIVTVLDTETSNDQYQNLLFGSFGIWITDKLHKFVIFYSDKLTKKEIRILKNHTQQLRIENVKVELLPVSRFIHEIFCPWVYEVHAVLVGFNLPFDISRLAINYGLSRERWKGGFTFTLSKSRFLPQIRIKSLDSTKAFIEFAKPSKRNQKHPKKHFKGRFLDLRTLGFALTNEKLSLDWACDIFKTKYRKTKTEEHGKITPEYVDYNVNDVLATYHLYLKMLERYYSLNLELQPEKIYSPASIGKQYLKQIQIKPFRKQNPNFLPEILGFVMTTYYGGRSEIRIRKKPMKIRYMDFTSMYPAQFSLMNLWDYLIAEEIECVEATTEVQNSVKKVNLKTLRNPVFWKNLVVIVQIQPENDILPVRSHYEEKYVYNIGMPHLKSSANLWYALPDVIASKLLTGKSPKILRAIKFVPKGKQDGLKQIEIVGGYKISPEEDFILKLVLLRKKVQRKIRESKKNSSEYQMPDKLQNNLKIIANAASYGIFVEINTKDKESVVDVYGLEHFKTKASKEESFGHYFNPIISTMLTSGARLLLAMAESWLEKNKGYYAFCDTDSIAVSPFHWKKLQQYFEPLNPFGEGEFLKLEKENYDKTDRLRDLWFYGISAKRYVFFTYKNGEPIPIDDGWSSHGLGHLKLENKKEWEKQLWTNILRYALGKLAKKELLAIYENEFSVAKFALTKPYLLLRVKEINKRKLLSKRIKPYNFVIVGSPTSFNRKGDPIIPVTQFIRPYDLAPYQPFTDAKTGKLFNEHTELYWKKLDKTVEEYVEHPESKFEKGHRNGTMKRRHLTIDSDSIIYIGKESNELEETDIIGIIDDAYIAYNRQ